MRHAFLARRCWFVAGVGGRHGYPGKSAGQPPKQRPWRTPGGHRERARRPTHKVQTCKLLAGRLHAYAAREKGLTRGTALEKVYRVVEEVYHHFVECRWPAKFQSRFPYFAEVWLPGFQGLGDSWISGFCDFPVLCFRGPWEKLGARISGFSALGIGVMSGSMYLWTSGFLDFGIL